MPSLYAFMINTAPERAPLLSPFVCYRFSLVSFRSFHLLSIHRPSKVVPLGLFRKEAQQQNRVRMRESRDEPCFGGAQQRAHTQPRKCSIHQYRQVKKARKKHTLLFASSLWHKIFLVSRVPTHRSKGEKTVRNSIALFTANFRPKTAKFTENAFTPHSGTLCAHFRAEFHSENHPNWTTLTEPDVATALFQVENFYSLSRRNPSRRCKPLRCIASFLR